MRAIVRDMHTLQRITSWRMNHNSNFILNQTSSSLTDSCQGVLEAIGGVHQQGIEPQPSYIRSDVLTTGPLAPCVLLYQICSSIHHCSHIPVPTLFLVPHQLVIYVYIPSGDKSYAISEYLYVDPVARLAVGRSVQRSSECSNPHSLATNLSN